MRVTENPTAPNNPAAGKAGVVPRFAIGHQFRFTQTALVFLALGWAGCTTPHMRLYEGAPRGRAEIAVLKIQWNFVKPSARIETIDGTPVEKGRIYSLHKQSR